MKKTIGILGGMGPLATADLFRKITLFTKAGCDNDHIRVYIDSNAQIPDRTAAILNGGKDPLPEMRAALLRLRHCRGGHDEHRRRPVYHGAGSLLLYICYVRRRTGL